MKFNKSLMALAVSGLVALPCIQGLQAAEHTFTWGGNLRVESVSTSMDDVLPAGAGPNGTAGAGETVTIETLATSFGGLEDESTTGGDTYIQLNYGYESDDGSTTGSGFVRFASDRQIRIGVSADAEGDVYAASMKAEWQQLGWVGADGTGGVSRSERDQFAVLTHKPTSLYFKIGRDEPFGNEKGYTTDFLSATKGYADTGTGRVAGHILGWTDSDLGLDLGLFIQRDNTGENSAKGSARPLGYGFDASQGRQDVNGFGFIVKYASGPVDAELITGSATAATNEDRGDAKYERGVSITQLHLVADFGQFKPFVNFGSATITETVGTAAETEATEGGNNLGVSVGFGFADLVVAFGSAAAEDAAGEEIAKSGFDLMFATNQEPLLVSFAFTSDTTTTTPVTGAEEEIATSQYGVRFDYGF